MNVEFNAFFRARILALPYISASARGELYRAALAALDDFIARSSPALDAAEIAAVRKQVNDAIDEIEAEFELAAAQGRRLPDWAMGAASPRATDDASAGAGYPPSEMPLAPSPYIPVSDEELARLVAHATGQRLGLGALGKSLSDRFSSVGLALRHYIHATAGGDKLGYLWIIFEPVAQIAIVVSMYWFFGINTIQGMPALPFAAIGVSAWLMIRMSLMHNSFGLGREAGLCVYPSIIPLDVKLAKTLFYAVLYFMVFLGFSLICLAYGYIDGVKDVALAIIYWILLMVFGFGLSLAFGRLFHVFPEIQRLILVLLRALYLFSGAILVTEQIPKEYAAYFLWNPMVHGMQLLRSAYFMDYNSSDASISYFLVGTLFMLTFGIICERANYKEEITA
ncbi:MAG TPA: ABC transporter permease [Rhabdaerophilum sp.]|nr:ABC transporter permease [Rhabdaerophilum sp.]